jgi:hypothetical protein
MPFGSWPDLVNRGGLGVLPYVPVQRWGGKTALFLRGNFSIALGEAPARSTSPNMAKSQDVVAMFVHCDPRLLLFVHSLERPTIQGAENDSSRGGIG